jgi:asparagine N-glycosylation enzyme membrane subunit Stt3
MEFLKTHQNELLLIIPAISMFVITLLTTINHSWPLSWDVMYHVLYAKVYSQYGFVLVNPLLNYPTGQKIGYPPLFHFLIASLGTIFRVDYLMIARALQPFLAFFVILSVTFVAKKFYGTIAGLSAGFLMISSTIIYRIMLPVPENLALIFFPLAVYLYYVSITGKNIKYALVSGVLMLIIAATHQAALLCLILLITGFTIIELIIYRNTSVLKNYGAFLLSLVVIMGVIVVALLIFKPTLIQSIFNQGITAVLGFGTSINYNQPLSFVKYIRNFGLLLTVFSLLGVILAVMKRRKKDVYIFTWIIIMVLLSKAYYFGINVLSARVLIYIVIPLSIIGGFGVSEVYYRLKDHKRFSSKRFRTSFLVCVLSLSLLFGVLNISDPNLGTYTANTVFGSVQIAPPISSEVELANWFRLNGDKNKSISISNLYTGVFVARESGMPINYEFANINNETPKSYFESNNIGYIIYDKRLVLPPDFNTLNRYQANSEMYPLFYYNNILYQNVDKLKPHFTTVIYENKNFIVCEV